MVRKKSEGWGCLKAQRRHVLAEGGVEALGAEHVLAQEHEARAGLRVAEQAEAVGADMSG